MSQSAAIELQDIEFSWKTSLSSKPIISIDSLKIEKGERVFLYGPSGSGKTTLLSLLSGIVIPQKGTIRIEDQVISSLSSAQRDIARGNLVGYIFQQFNLIPYLSIIDNVLLPLQFSKDRRQGLEQKGLKAQSEALRLLEALGLENELVNQQVSRLSVGQRQRCAAARALIGAPPVLIADEPTSALDADRKIQFIDLLFSECEKHNLTVVFVSHDQSLANKFQRSYSIKDFK